ncbi:MAG: Abi family protein [Succinivibrionaceae bacterium]|nr:Abi family protein [Succinivibrionaceae bacterium]
MELIHANIIRQFQEEIKRNKNLPFVKHHNTKYNSKFPIWVAVELFSFGQLSSLYSIMKSKDRKEIARQYDCSPNDLGVWIQCLVEVRNICAHYGRLYNLPLRFKPPLPLAYQKYYRAQNKLFPVIVVLKLLLLSHGQWNSFFEILNGLMNKYKHVVNLSFIGFPPEWEMVLSR